jgi:hypothetical protein
MYSLRNMYDLVKLANEHFKIKFELDLVRIIGSLHIYVSMNIKVVCMNGKEGPSNNNKNKNKNKNNRDHAIKLILLL